MSMKMSHPTNRVPGFTETRKPSTELSDVDTSELFSREELRQFANEDREAGRRIAVILISLFIYPLVVMTVVIWWTFHVVGH